VLIPSQYQLNGQLI